MRFMNINVIGISLSLLLSFQVAWAHKQANSKSNIVQEQSKDASSNVIKRRVLTKDLQNNNEVYYFNNQPYTGTSIDLFDNKTKMQEINWKDGLLHGDKTEYFLGGNQVRAKLAFNMGKRNGPFVYYHENGNIQLIGKYINDELDSTVTCLYDNGLPKYIHQYIKGIRTGWSMTYYKNGQLEQKVYLTNDVPNGLMQSYYPAGNIRSEIEYANGIRNGKCYKYHLTGLIAEETYYKQGLLDSISRYSDNVFGVVLKEAFFRLGKREGNSISFNEAGDTLNVYHYENDVLNGPYMKYFSGVKDFGKKKTNKPFDPKTSNKQYVRGLDEVGAYKNGLIDGPFKSGLFNKAEHVEGEYASGKMVGEWRYYNEKGKMVLYQKYNSEGELLEQKPKQK
jgi:antitoxin component YwqK of YwqJK toxin-antitoxin module